MKLIFLTSFLFLLSFVAGFAQSASMFEEALTKAGIENVSCLENDSVYIITIENNIWKLKGAGIHTVINLLPVSNKPVRIIVLDNNIPGLLLSSPGKDDWNIKNWSVSYQTDSWWKEIKHNNYKNSSLFKFDVVLYPEIYFRNIKLYKMYDWVVNISPALKFSAWRGMKFTGQVIFPVINQYGESYKQVRPGFVTLSQQLRFRHQWFAKATAGIFNRDRWGADLRIFHPLSNERFALRMQAGLTGTSSFWNWKWYYSNPKRLTWNMGGQYYNPRYNVQCMINGGRYLAGDYGARVDVMRHFRYSTIGFYGVKTNKSVWNGGFYFTVALPPYKQKRNRVRITTADYFNFEYSAEANFYYGQMYKTSPQENSSEGNFNPFFIKSEF